jgi:hypothetical protein
MKTTKTKGQRVADWRKRLEAKGGRTLYVMLSPVAAKALADAQARTGQTARQVVEGMLVAQGVQS